MKTILTILSFLFLCLIVEAQNAQRFTISGYIEDLESGEKLITANLFDLKSAKGTISNTYGFYSFTLPKDSVYLRYSFIGYESRELVFYLQKDTTINVKLQAALALDEVEVVAEKYEEIQQRTEMSTVDVPISQIKKIPALFGEVDVLKALQLLPGVQSGGEGQNGLYVRGGSPDQNLILLDGVPVYNASHLFGFFSVFNVDAIKDVKLTKGGFPARYGGRLSSVIEINMKEGDVNDWHGTGTIGLISSKFTIEGPLKKDKTSLIFSARRTYIDVLAKPLIKKGFKDNGTEGTAGYFFHDINGKINHKLSDKDRIYFSIYTGKDKFYFEEQDKFEGGSFKTVAGLGWGNFTSALRWNHVWTNKLFSNTTLTYSRYKFDTTAEEEDINSFNGIEEKTSFRLNYLSGINDLAVKIDFDFVPDPNHYIRFGISAIHHTFKPGAFDFDVLLEDGADDFRLDTIIGQKDVQAQEFAAYFEDDMRLGDRFKMNAGLHISGFNHSKKFYYSFQPRVGMRYLLPNDVALKASFATMRQYVQLLTNEGIGLPTDLWLPTTDRIIPQDSWQAAIGAAKTFSKKYELSIEAYYKRMNNITSYKEGASLFELSDWQDRITQGTGEAYGLEFFLQKKRGRLSGWIGYTLAWSNRTFDDLNFGKTYPFKYDRRHDLSVVVSYKISDRIQLSGTWVYGTGNAVTLANSQYEAVFPEPGFPAQFNRFARLYTVEHFPERNNFRMRSYHRMDVGIEFTKQKKRYSRTWSFGAYNTYNRKNPFFLFVDTEAQYDSNGNFIDSKSVLKQASLFPVIPYFSYRFEF